MDLRSINSPVLNNRLEPPDYYLGLVSFNFKVQAALNMFKKNGIELRQPTEVCQACCDFFEEISSREEV